MDKIKSMEIGTTTMLKEKIRAAQKAAYRMIAERDREIRVSIRALRMMQAHYGNPYFSFKCIPDAEVAEWMEKSEAEEVKVK